MRVIKVLCGKKKVKRENSMKLLDPFHLTKVVKVKQLKKEKLMTRNSKKTNVYF